MTCEAILYGVVQLLNLKNHDRVNPLLKVFLILFVISFVGLLINKRLAIFGAGFVVLIYTLMIVVWIMKGIG